MSECDHSKLIRKEYTTEHQCAGRFEIKHSYWQCDQCGEKHKLKKSFKASPCSQ
jgi:hypothetical protein